VPRGCHASMRDGVAVRRTMWPEATSRIHD
jgi:hypothetical protein